MNDSATQDKDLITETVVYDFLQENPDFFYRYPELLNQIRLPHQQRGSISLVERQQELQRTKIQALEDDITRLMSIARQNEHIFTALNQLHTSLFQAKTAEQIDLSLQVFARQMPGVHQCRLLPLAEQQDIDPLRLLISRRLGQSPVYLGRLNKEERQIIFTDSIHSVALILIQQQQKPVALLAFGSEQDEHFQPAMDKLFIRHLAELLAMVLQPYESD